LNSSINLTFLLDARIDLWFNWSVGPAVDGSVLHIEFAYTWKILAKMENMVSKAETTVSATHNARLAFGKLSDGQPTKAGRFGQKSTKQASMASPMTGPEIPKRATLCRGSILQTAGKQLAGAGVGPSEAAGSGAANAPPPPPASSIDLGPNLMAAYHQLDMAGSWLEKLQTELGEVLGKVGAGSGFSFLPETDSTNIDHYDSGEGGVLDGWRWTYPARHRRNRLGELSVVLDLGRPGRAASIIGMPCMVVMWSTAAHNWAASVDAAAGFWPPSSAAVELHGDRVFKWAGNIPGNGPAAALPFREAAWFYLVRLTALTNFAALRTYVVHPVLTLLAETEADSAFAKAPDVLRFRQQQNTFVVND
jgi:hypothetical protein